MKDDSNDTALSIRNRLLLYRRRAGHYNHNLSRLLALANRVLWAAIWKSKHKIKDPSISSEDIHQDLLLWLSRNWRKWDPKRGAWSTWVTLRAYRAVNRTANKGPLGILPAHTHSRCATLAARRAASPVRLDAHPAWGITLQAKQKSHEDQTETENEKISKTENIAGGGFRLSLSGNPWDDDTDQHATT